MPCKRSDTREKCGSWDRMSVYKMTGNRKKGDRDDDRYDDSYKSKGCYIDSGRKRIIPIEYARRSMFAEVSYRFGCFVVT